ncbi:MAG: hypothetical protein AB7F40_04815 [Victivallaceae bacterium]
MSESSYRASLSRHFRRGDIVAAVGITLAFHALLLAVFRAEPAIPEPLPPPAPAVMFIDLNAPDPTGQIVAFRNFIFEHDPALLPVGSRATGFSRVLRAPAFRTPLASPQMRNTGPDVLPVETPAAEFSIVIPPAPNASSNAMLLSTALTRRMAQPVAGIYPFAEIDGRPAAAKLSSPAPEILAALSSPVTVAEFSFEEPRSLPRIEITQSCGNAKLDAAAVAACLPGIPAATGKIVLTVYWREQ